MLQFKNRQAVEAIVDYVKSCPMCFTKHDVLTHLSGLDIEVNPVEVDKIIADFLEIGTVKTDGHTYRYVGYALNRPV